MRSVMPGTSSQQSVEDRAHLIAAACAPHRAQHARRDVLHRNVEVRQTRGCSRRSARQLQGKRLRVGVHHAQAVVGPRARPGLDQRRAARCRVAPPGGRVLGDQDELAHARLDELARLVEHGRGPLRACGRGSRGSRRSAGVVAAVRDAQVRVRAGRREQSRAVALGCAQARPLEVAREGSALGEPRTAWASSR